MVSSHEYKPQITQDSVDNISPAPAPEEGYEVTSSLDLNNKRSLNVVAFVMAASRKELGGHILPMAQRGSRLA